MYYNPFAPPQISRLQGIFGAAAFINSNIMATVKFQGNPVKTSGNLPAAGADAPAFTLVGQDLADISLEDFKGKQVVLNIFPSLDTDVCAVPCAASIRMPSNIPTPSCSAFQKTSLLPRPDSAPSTASKT